MLRILIADGHEVVRRGVRRLIESRPDWQVCGEADSVSSAAELAAVLKPDVIVLELNMPDERSIAEIRRIRGSLPKSELLIFTMYNGAERIPELIAAGANGFLLKTAPTSEIVLAIEALARHRPYFTASASAVLRDAFLRQALSPDRSAACTALSPRERQIVQLLAEASSNKEVASKLRISIKTVETHRAAIMRKLKLRSVVELVHYAIRNRIVAA
jgi:DNA-binding NarL/FixJ family response regulator